jgi:hypothetical protein
MNPVVLEALHGEALAMVASVKRTRCGTSLMDGSAGIATYANYMREVYHYMHAGQSALVLAVERMLEQGRHVPLALLLQEKAVSTAGLDLRVLADLETLGFSRADVINSTPAPATQAYIAWSRFLALSDHPLGHFGDVYMLEYLAATCAGPVADGLARTGRIPGIRRALGFVRGRADAREGQVRTLAGALPPVEDPAEVDVILTSARATRLLYGGILSAVDGMSTMPARRARV